jgi:adenylate cyclase
MVENRKLAAILAADIVGFSRLTGIDEDRTLARLRALRSDLIDPTISVHNGRVFKRTGDGVLIEFRSAVDAVRCAIEVQNAMVDRNAGVAEDRRIEFRIGIHVGDVVEETDGDLMGDGVNIAARLEGIAKPGAICLSEQAYWQVKARLDLAVSDLGATQLKNIAEAVRVFSLRVGLPDHTKAAYCADGISEDIITALSKLSQLFVIARNSSFAFKGMNVDVRDVSKRLDVRYVLEGSVRKSGNRVRITSQLIEATSGGHLWAERFDRDLTDIFAVQDDVTQQIVTALALTLSEGDRQRLLTEHTDNLEAYDLFLRGRELWWRQTKETNGKARELLQRASQADPSFAPAHAFLGAAHLIDYISGWSLSPSQSLEYAREAARRTVALDERYPIAHWAMAAVNLWSRQHDDAIREAERAILLNPNYADGHNFLGIVLHYAGRSEQSPKYFERAMALDPYFPDMWLHFQAQAAYQLGQYEAAATTLKRRIVRNPETDASRVLLAACYGQIGLVDEARQEWQEALRVNPNYSLEQRRKVLPYKNPADFELIVDGLRKAGLVD